MNKGIDISYHQGNIDFDLLKKNGVEFIIIREGYRKTIDSKFFEYVQKAIRAGIVILGVYHFSYALNEAESKEEATFCVENMKKAGLDSKVLVFYDFEYDTVKKAAQKGVKLGKAECNSHTVSFCEEVKRLGFIPGVYTNLDYYKNWYSKDILEKYYIWLADYNNGPDFECLIQQYSSTGRIPGVKGNVDQDYYYGSEFKIEGKNKRLRSEVVNLARSWVGKNEEDDSYKEIIDIYNSYSGDLPRGIKMLYDWAWCALGISLGYTDIMPIEISCGELIKKAKELGCWKENDGYVPLPGDGLLYDWDDSGVGVIEYCNPEAGYMVVIEGNYANAVKRRTISINGKYIRGFITPMYDDNSVIYETNGSQKDIATIAREVISGLWGNGPQRKTALENSGYNYAEVQEKVNEILNGPAKRHPSVSTAAVTTTCYAKSNDLKLNGSYVTTADLYCRNDAGTNKKALCLVPKGLEVKNYGFYTEYKGVKWLLIKVKVNGIWYVGFSSSRYLKKIG